MLYFEQGVIKVWRRIFQGYQIGFLSGAIDCWKSTEVLCWEGIQPAFELSKEEHLSLSTVPPEGKRLRQGWPHVTCVQA